MKNAKLFSFLVLVPLALSGCSNAKEQMGLTRKAPDEFAVVKRAPLSMPPDYSLRPPQPGAPRPQEQSTSEQAKQAVFGEDMGVYSSTSAGDAESALVQQAGATSADPAIRQKIDGELEEYEDVNKPVAQKLLGIVKETPPSATVVNAKEESERLLKNAEQGKPVTEGETPSIQQ
jgi:hypothetical protein